eukprot:g6111.t1
MVSLHLLTCAVQNYAWGKMGTTSKVGQLVKAGGRNVDESKPYAEYWFGTHPSGPAHMKGDSEILLSDYLSTNQKAMGSLAGGTSGSKGQLPFLFKVLSVNKALSIQCHPNRKEAIRLHAKDPEHYRDDNHKPEMAVALTDFEAMCGFRSMKEISELFKLFPEWSCVVGEKWVKAVSEVAMEESNESLQNRKKKEAAALEGVVRSWMSCDATLLSQQLDLLVDRLSKKQMNSSSKVDSSLFDLKALEELLLRLSHQYPGDVGIFAPLLLNYLQLKPGQCIFLSAMVPHAYLKGDIVECMACSNNVIRAGLTPKFRDVEELCDCLCYETSQPLEQMNNLVSKRNGNTTVYSPPIDEFVITQISLRSKNDSETQAFEALQSPSIIVVTKGSGTFMGAEKNVSYSEGSVYLLEANASAVATAAEPSEIFRVNVKPGKESQFL